MIGRLTGRVAECEPGAVLVDVGGVGYSLQIPLSTYYDLVHRPDGTVSLHVHTHVREDALVLFGFATVAERTAFRRVLDGDRDRLQRIPGIGRKTAERVLLELRDRLDREARVAERPARERPAGDADAPADSVRRDANSALQNLGYTRDAAGKAVDRALEALDAEPSLENVLKAALSGLVRSG
jgi:Holliday junction DNA helicase RuvA